MTTDVHAHKILETIQNITDFTAAAVNKQTKQKLQLRIFLIRLKTNYSSSIRILTRSRIFCICACGSARVCGPTFLVHPVHLTTTSRQTWLFSSTSTYHSTDLLTARGVAHLVVHGTTGSTSYETIPPVRLERFGGVLSTVDMVVQRRDGPRRLPNDDDDEPSTLLLMMN